MMPWVEIWHENKAKAVCNKDQQHEISKSDGDAIGYGTHGNTDSLSKPPLVSYGSNYTRRQKNCADKHVNDGNLNCEAEGYGMKCLGFDHQEDDKTIEDSSKDGHQDVIAG